MFSGCANRNYTIARASVVSTQNVRGLHYDIVAGSNNSAAVEGESCFSFDKLSGYSDDYNDNIGKAMSSAIENGRKKGIDGDILVNINIDQENRSDFFTRRICTIVKGLLVKYAVGGKE